jgi:hypothetical protein
MVIVFCVCLGAAAPTWAMASLSVTPMASITSPTDNTHTSLFSTFLLCSSRACLGKLIFFCLKMAPERRVSAPIPSPAVHIVCRLLNSAPPVVSESEMVVMLLSAVTMPCEPDWMSAFAAVCIPTKVPHTEQRQVKSGHVKSSSPLGHYTQ